MKTFKKTFCVILALIVMIVPFNFIYANAATGVTSFKIVKLPDKLKFYRESDWDYGEWVTNSGNEDSCTWRPDSSKISFMYHPGSGLYPERGMVDMRGLQVEVTYSNGSKKTITYSETFSNSHYYPNLVVIPYKGKQFFVGTNTMDVYLQSDPMVSDTYQIEIIDATAPTRVLGDVNNDGKVNSSDALLVLQHSVNLITLTSDQKNYADMNKDGIFNSLDALYILQKSVS